MILLTNDTALVGLEAGYEAVCVRHRSYKPPETLPGCLHVTYEELEQDFARIIDGKTTLIGVGLNRIITPSNRARVGALLLKPRASIERKISVDTSLFVVEPWRTYFHFGFTRQRYREFTYSYLAESRWKASLEAGGEDPFSFERICEEGADMICSTDREHFGALHVERIALPASTHVEYQELKRACFDEETTIAAILKRLSGFAQEALSSRSVPTVAQLFAAGHRTSIVQTDLKIDDHLVGVLRERARLVDAIAEHFYDAD